MEMPLVDMEDAIAMVTEQPEDERAFSVFLSDLLCDPEVIASVQERFEDIGVIADLVAEQASTIARLAGQVDVLAARIAELERALIKRRLG